MMNEDVKTLAVELLDKEYSVSCPAGEEEDLRLSAQYLDEKMREIRLHGKTVGLERIAVMTALNLAHELLQSKKEQDQQSKNSQEQLSRLMNKLDTAISESSESD